MKPDEISIACKDMGYDEAGVRERLNKLPKKVNARIIKHFLSQYEDYKVEKTRVMELKKRFPNMLIIAPDYGKNEFVALQNLSKVAKGNGMTEEQLYKELIKEKKMFSD